MKHALHQKLRCPRGLSRLAAILLIAIAILLAIAAAPVLRYYTDRAARIGCTDAMEAANRALKEQYILRGGGTLTAQEAMAIIENVMPGRDNLCPAGGSVYLADRPGETMPYALVCGAHDSDGAERTRLNAGNALEQIRKAAHNEALMERPCPDTVVIALNGEELTAYRVTEDQRLRRGTSATMDLEGTVVYYGTASDFDTSVRDAADQDSNMPAEAADQTGNTTAEATDQTGNTAAEAADQTAGMPFADFPEDAIAYFAYADENYCANWRADDGWSGDAYAAQNPEQTP